MRKVKLLRRAVALVLLFLYSSVNVFAQNRTVSGVITDQNGKGIPGVTVTVKGTKTATQTDANGTYRFSVPDNAVLVFSSVGFGTSELTTVGRTPGASFDATLQSSNANLSEVVVIGYGSRRVKDATGSVAALSSKDFNKGVISTPEQLLQGRTPGVIVTPSSGEPGASASINIRGTASIRSNQEPLYIVDGVPISPGGTTGTASGVEGSSTPKNPLSFLNPNDIESISVLKDASSAAIYGSRGANGVIIITTKSGRGSGGFQFSTTTSVSRPASRYNLLNASEFLVALKNAKLATGRSDAEATADVASKDRGFSTDWQDEIFRTGIAQNYNLSWGFGKKATALRLSGSYDNQQGIIKNSDLKRATGRANLTQRFMNDRLRFDVSLTYSQVKNNYPPLTNNAGYQGSLIGAAIALNPTFPIFNTDGTYFDLGDGNRNPVEMLAYFDDKDKTKRLLTNVSGTFEIVKGLSYKATFGYDKSTGERLSFADPRLSSGTFGGTSNVFGVNLNNPIEGNGRGVKQNLDLKTILVEHTLTYDRLIGSGQAINAVVGYAYQSTETNYKGQVGWGLSAPVVKAGDVFSKNFNQFKKYYDFIPDFTKYDLQSYFGRVNYTIDDKYLLTATMRVDGSSKFGINNKYGYFPAFAAKWRLLKEEFINKPFGRTFSDISIRGNYGILGSQEGLGAYDAVDLSQTYLGNSGQKETQLVHVGNKDLKWEQSATKGIGLDFGLFSNRLSGTIDYYYTKRKDLLYFGPTPGGFSASTNWFTNLPGEVINKGWEFSLNYTPIKSKKFTWDINYNMTFIKNELRNFGVDVITGAVSGQGLSGAYAQTFANGSPLFTWKMPTFYGYDLQGFARYGDQLDHISGSALPKFLAGLTNSFTLGDLSASVFFNTVRGFYVYNNTANALFVKGSLLTAHNLTREAANSPENPINPGSVSTRFLEKGDFIRLSNATLSYAFRVKSKTIRTLSVTATGQNLALFTNYTGLDPEVNVDKQINGVPSRGFDYTGYPKPRTVSLGVNIGFK